jgi:hypothetical protein
VGRVDGLSSIDEALDRVEALMPGLLERPRDPLVRALRDLSRVERAVVRQAILEASTRPERLRSLIGDVSGVEAASALERIETVESVAKDLMALLRLFEQVYCAPVLMVS